MTLDDFRFTRDPRSRRDFFRVTGLSETATRGHRSLVALVACLALLALPIGACGDDEEKAGGGRTTTAEHGGPARSSAKVNIASFKFLPDPIRVKAGGRVTWVNQDKAPHTAQTEESSTAAFDTERLDPGEQETVTLERPGKFGYFCVYHRFMEGTVEVVE